MKGNVELLKNIVLDISKYVTNGGFTYFGKKESISLAFLLNYFIIHYLKKALISLRNVPKLSPFVAQLHKGR